MMMTVTMMILRLMDHCGRDHPDLREDDFDLTPFANGKKLIAIDGKRLPAAAVDYETEIVTNIKRSPKKSPSKQFSETRLKKENVKPIDPLELEGPFQVR